MDWSVMKTDREWGIQTEKIETINNMIEYYDMLITYILEKWFYNEDTQQVSILWNIYTVNRVTRTRN